jgi:O-antigen/teichoic acid export membrane protein
VSSSLTGGVTFLTMHQVFAFLATGVLQVVAARAFGPEAYGTFAIVQSLLAVLLFTALTGVPHAVAAETARDADCARGVVRSGVVLQLLIGGVLGVAVFALAGPVASWLGDPLLADLLRWLAPALPLTGAAYVWIFALNGLHRFGRQAAALVLLTGTKAGAVILVILFGGGAVAAMEGIAAAAALAVAGTAALLRDVPGLRPFPLRALAGPSLQLGATYVAVAIWDQSDLLLLRAFGANAADVGLLAAASTVAAAPVSLFAPLATALFPAVSRAVAAGTLDSLRDSVSVAVDLAYRALVPLLAFGVVFGPDLAAVLFGAEYRAAGRALAVLLVGSLGYAVYEILDTVLRAGGRARLSWQVAGVALLAHVGCGAVLMPRYGLDGAAWTRLLSSGIAVAAVGFPVARWLALRPGAVTVGRPLVAAAAAFVPFVGHVPSGIGGLLLGGAGFLIYLGVLALLRGIHADDVRRVREITAILGSLFGARRRP